MKDSKRESVQALQKMKEKLLRAIKLPEDALPGSLSVSRFRCGKSSCHCREGEGHENWTLTYMRNGVKRVKHIPSDLVDSAQQRVERGKTFKEAVNEIFGANAELLILLRKDNKKS